MNELDNSPNEERAQGGEPWPSPGRMLRHLRESRGMSQAQVGEALHLTLHYINALENDQYQKLPGRIFAKGYLKTYAELLGANVDEVVERFEHLTSAREESVEADQQRQRRRQVGDQSRVWMMSAGVLIVAVLGIAWWFGREESPPAAPRAASPASAQAGAAASRTPRASAAEALMNATRAASPAGGQARETAAPAQEAQPLQEGAPQDGLSQASPEPMESGRQEQEAEAVTEPVLALAEEQSTDFVAESPSPDDESRPALLIQAMPEGGRAINLDSPGDDLLVVHFTGTSWIAVDNGANERLYNDNQREGDALTIRGEAPFRVVLGDARVVDLEFNSRDIGLSTVTRADNTARLTLEP